MTTTHIDGALVIAQERARQKAIEGWDAEHDREHERGELVWAARSYAAVYDWPAEMARERITAENVGWPWEMEWWKPTDDPIRNLAKAGALIAAEIDRLLLAQGHEPSPAGGADLANLIAAARAEMQCQECGLNTEELATLLRVVGLADLDLGAVSTEAAAGNSGLPEGPDLEQAPDGAVESTVEPPAEVTDPQFLGASLDVDGAPGTSVEEVSVHENPGEVPGAAEEVE